MILNLRRSLVALALSALLASTARGQSDDVLSQAGFGSAVAVVGEQILVGEPLNSGLSGRVYVYRMDSTSSTWGRVQVLEPTDGSPGNGFGLAVAGSGDLCAIVAHDNGENRIYVFRQQSDGEWLEEAILRPGSGSDYNFLDESVAVIDDRVLVTVSTPEGGVRVVAYTKSPLGPWVESGSIELPTDATIHVSRPVAASGDLLFVGAPGERDGAVYVVNTAPRPWRLAQTLKDGSDGGGEPSLFGTSIALTGTDLAIGAPGANGGRGAVHVYRPDAASEFKESQVVKAFEDTSRFQFGSVLSASDGSLAVGAYDDEHDTGVAYVFDERDGTYEPSHLIGGDTMEEDAEFATALASGSGLIVIGAMADVFGYGSAFVYQRGSVGAEWALAAQLKPDLVYRQQAITGGRVKCEDGKAASFDCSNVDIISFIPNEDLGSDWGIQTNDVWGWTDPETGKEYAIVCTFGGTVFVDVSDPAHPIVLGELPMTPGTRPNWWRDAKTYGNYVYIVADNVGDHGLQIFDLTQLRTVENPPLKFEPTAHYGGFDSAHNIIINESTGFAYVVGISGGGNTCGGGSHILDLSDPVHPKFVGCFAHEGTGEQLGGYTHDAQCVVYRGPDERYTGREICVAANETAISIADFTDKANIVPISAGRYPNVSYAHQGWLTEDHRYYLQNDEADEINGMTTGTRTLVWDLAELDDPVLVDEHVSTNLATDHNLFINGAYMYQSNYLSGLRVYDVSDPVQMREVGYFDTVPWGDDRPGFGGSWSNYPFFGSGLIVVTSGEEGVFFLRRSDIAP
ncbi:MAG TPA: choice-of-anchor B family protein [Rhodothermales bacterium]|nr:choice-of-anchor B family protein [Rhodothermales bacterium]